MEDPADYQKSWKKYKSGVEDMPNLPWDDENVAPNLLTLSRLRSGDKLSVLSSSANPGLAQFENLGEGNRGLRARFDIQRGGISKLKQKWERSKKGEDILIDNQYLIPLRNLFTRARALFIAGQRGISLINIQNAYNGLSNMVMTFQRDNDSRRGMKMIAIQQVLSPLIPSERDREVIALKRGSQLHNVFLYTRIWPNLNNTALEFLNMDNNATGRTEQGVGETLSTLNPNVTLGDITDVIDEMPEMFRLTQATTLPTLTAPYTRQGLGVCRQFIRDLDGRPPNLNGTPMKRTWEGLRDLLIELRGDEGMFFLVSQLCSQHGLPAFPVYFFKYRYHHNKTNGPLGYDEYVFFYDGIHWCPIRSSDQRTFIDTTQREITIRVETDIEASFFFKSEQRHPIGALEVDERPPFSLKVVTMAALRRARISDTTITMRMVRFDVKADCT